MGRGSLFHVRLFLWRRYYGLALIAEGFARFFGFRLGLPMETARRIARMNGRRYMERNV